MRDPTAPAVLAAVLAAVAGMALISCAGLGTSAGATTDGFDALRLDGPERGPVLMVVSGIHGDEPSGPEALRLLASGPAPSRGSVVVVPEACSEALAAGRRRALGWSDLNRAFGAAARRDRFPSDPATVRAAALFALVESERPALLLDFHESDDAWAEGAGPAVVVPRAELAAALALRLLERPALARWSFTGPPPEGSLVAAANDAGTTALIVEIPGAWPRADRVSACLELTDAAMSILGMNP